MWVIFTHDVTDDTGAFLVRLSWVHTRFIHAEDDAALNRFEAVADIWDRTGDDDRHRIIQEGGTHFGRDIAFDQAWDDARYGRFFAEHCISGLVAFMIEM